MWYNMRSCSVCPAQPCLLWTWLRQDLGAWLRFTWWHWFWCYACMLCLQREHVLSAAGALLVWHVSVFHINARGTCFTQPRCSQVSHCNTTIDCAITAAYADASCLLCRPCWHRPRMLLANPLCSASCIFSSRSEECVVQCSSLLVRLLVRRLTT